MKKSDWADKKAESFQMCFYAGDISEGTYFGMCALGIGWKDAFLKELRTAEKRGFERAVKLLRERKSNGSDAYTADWLKEQK